ncbi:MAG: hypothetical protein J5I65_08735 [Aridibacter famidurans]|nr:hypothetical protein [Aridibacter famidurans]
MRTNAKKPGYERKSLGEGIYVGAYECKAGDLEWAWFRRARMESGSRDSGRIVLESLFI